MMLFGVEVLRLPFNDPAFWNLPRAFFVGARVYHDDRIEAEREAVERAEKKRKK